MSHANPSNDHTNTVGAAEFGFQDTRISAALKSGDDIMQHVGICNPSNKRILDVLFGTRSKILTRADLKRVCLSHIFVRNVLNKEHVAVSKEIANVASRGLIELVVENGRSISELSKAIVAIQEKRDRGEQLNAGDHEVEGLDRKQKIIQYLRGLLSERKSQLFYAVNFLPK